MSLKASEVPRRLGIPHETLEIPWGSLPYPTKPSPSQSFERIARDARYTLLLSGMRRHEANAIAFGHHADDQLETFLMRLANGTGFLGLGGMKHVRRLGMGDGSPGQTGWYGVDGMQRWIIRPLLGVSKDRVLATCEQHGLEYVIDKTNFQPEITLRNAVRHALAGSKTTDDIRHSQVLQKAVANAERLGVPLTLSKGIERLRSLANTYASEVERIETEARVILSDCVVTSPPSTVLLSQDKLSQITNPHIQRSMVVQILRFVSPHPWGSSAAEVSRNSTSLGRIVDSLFHHLLDETSAKRSTFSAGSHVLWTPVYIGPDGQLKYKKLNSGVDGWTDGWLASRSPPYRSVNGPSGFDIDVTPLILDKKSSTGLVEVLFDNRFILSFNPHAIPDEVVERLLSSPESHRLVVTAAKKYLLPRLVFRSSTGNDIEEIGTSDDSQKVRSVSAVPGDRSHLFGTGWASWRLARVFE